MALFKHSGSAPTESLWPLRALASADAGRISALGDATLSCPLPSGSLEFDASDRGLWLTIRGDDGEIMRKALVRGWGDEGSEAYWWPFNWLEEVRDVENLSTAIARAKVALERLSFYIEEPIQAADGPETAAVDYLRLASGVTEEWIISLAAPHELILEESELGGDRDWWFSLDQLPPGLAAKSECAFIGKAHDDIDEWWMRPVMCVFDNELGERTLDDLRDRLVMLDFTAEEIEQLDQMAGKVRKAYAYETTGVPSGSYSG